MVKKISRIAALFAATALLFGAIGCSDDDDGDDPTLEKIAISIDEKTVKTTYTVGEPFDKSGITVTATYSDDSTEDVTAEAGLTATTDDGKTFTTETEGSYKVILTATYEEKEAKTEPCTITVEASGSETETPTPETPTPETPTPETPTPETPTPEKPATTKTYVLEATALEAMAAGEKADGDTTTVGTSDYFTIYWSVKMKIDASTKSWDDGYSSTQRINMAGAWTGSKQFIKFTTTKAATVKVWWAEGDVNRPLQIGKYSGSTPSDIVAKDDTSTKKNDPHLSTLTLSEAGDWALGSGSGANYIFKIEVTE